MVIISLIVLSLFIVYSHCQEQECAWDQRKTRIQLGFDDYCNYGCKSLGLPDNYGGFVLSRAPDSGYGYRNIPVVNTVGIVRTVTYNVTDPLLGITNVTRDKAIDWQEGASSQPSVILTTGESMLIKMAGEGFKRTFVLESLSLMSIFIDRMNMTITFFNRETEVHRMDIINLPIGSRVRAVMDKMVDADQVTIGCTTRGYYTCAHVIYDDLVLFYDNREQSE